MSTTVQNRRRAVLHIGFGFALVASAAFSATACIFDEGGNYQGGGHIAQAATAQQDPSSSSSTSSSSSSSSSSGTDVGDASALVADAF